MEAMILIGGLGTRIKSIENNLMELNIDKITSNCIKDLAMQNIVFDVVHPIFKFL